MNKLQFPFYLFFASLFLISCGDDDVPGRENEEEVIDKVTLTFTPSQGSAIIVRATDPDGEGVANMAPNEAISLLSSTLYTLTIGVENTIAGDNIAEEIENEADEHMFFFSFTSDVFSDPSGDGNIDNRADALNYNDKDSNDLPLGLSTDWTTGNNSSGGSFRVVLKHQPGSKSGTSAYSDGSSDIDINWVINIVDGPL
jgi:hypothetical protein